MKKGMGVLVAGSILLAGCTTTEGKTTLGGAGLGAILGGVVGKVVGGDDGMVAGALIGAAAGAGAGSYVAGKKKQYATIEDRIAGERELVAQSIATTNAQIASSEAELRQLDIQIAALDRQRTTKAKAWERASRMLANLQEQRTTLEARQKTLTEQLANQQQFIKTTTRDIGRKQDTYATQLAAWRSDIPRMQQALTTINAQIANVNAAEARVLQVRASYS